MIAAAGEMAGTRSTGRASMHRACRLPGALQSNSGRQSAGIGAKSRRWRGVRQTRSGGGCSNAVDPYRVHPSVKSYLRFGGRCEDAIPGPGLHRCPDCDWRANYCFIHCAEEPPTVQLAFPSDIPSTCDNQLCTPVRIYFGTDTMWSPGSVPAGTRR